MPGSRAPVHTFRRRLGLVMLAGMLGAVLWAAPPGVSARTMRVDANLSAAVQPTLGSTGTAAGSWPVGCDSSQYARTLYVDVNHVTASDSNPGTESQPWRTIVHAGLAAGPDDRILIKAGVYDHGDIEIENGDTCFSAYPGQERQAIVRGAGISSYGNSNLVINGFKFEHSPEHSIRVVGPDAENIVVSNNHTYDTYKSGISIRGVTGNADPGDYNNIRNVLVTGNLVELANNNGGGSEIISVASGAVNVDVAYNEIRYGDPTFENGDEGISFKEGVRDSRIFGNIVHDLSDKAIHIDGGEREWDPLVTNIEIFDNVLYNLPSQGMWVVTEGQGDVDGVHIHDNIIYNVESNGILVYPHPDGVAAGGTVRNILIEHNTVWNAGSCGIKIRDPEATGIVIRDNIAWDNDGCGIWINDYTTIDSHNLCPEANLCGITTDPLFINPPADFGLLPGSPAIGTASDGTNLGAQDPTGGMPPGGTFIDDDDSIFEEDIEWLAAEGITKGCNPPTGDRFCPEANVTRGQMAAFLVRAMGYTDDGGGDLFTDDDDSIFEADIDRLAAAGVTLGCNPPANDRFCPEANVTRGQMAAFLVRAMGYTDDGGGDLFTDDDDSIFEADIDRLAAAGVTLGCNPPANDRFCPEASVTRGQMAAFLHRALG